MRNIHRCLDADAANIDQWSNPVLQPGVNLLRDLEGLGVLLQPGLLLGVPLQDGKQDDIEGRVGGGQHLTSNR